MPRRQFARRPPGKSLIARGRVSDIAAPTGLRCQYAMSDFARPHLAVCQQITESPADLRRAPSSRRMDLRMTQGGLAHRLGCTIEFVGKWERSSRWAFSRSWARIQAADGTDLAPVADDTASRPTSSCSSRRWPHPDPTRKASRSPRSDRSKLRGRPESTPTGDDREAPVRDRRISGVRGFLVGITNVAPGRRRRVTAFARTLRPCGRHPMHGARLGNSRETGNGQEPTESVSGEVQQPDRGTENVPRAEKA